MQDALPRGLKYRIICAEPSDLLLLTRPALYPELREHLASPKHKALSTLFQEEGKQVLQCQTKRDEES